MKKDTFWFPHDSNAADDDKTMVLIDQLGLEGYGIYWVLIEKLREKPDFRIPFSNIPALARRYATSAEKMKTVITQFGLFEYDEHGFFYSVSLIERMQTWLEKKQKASLAGKASAQKRLQTSTEKQQAFNGCSTNVQQTFNNCSTITEQNRTEDNRIEENITIQNIKESILTNTKENATNVATTQPPQQEIFSVPPQVETLPVIPQQEERKEKVARKRKESFVAPTVEQVRAYCRERGNTVDADKFCDYYTSVGWKVGRNPMKDWQSAVRTWERTNKNYNNENTRGINNTRKSEEQERAERDQYIFEKYLAPRLEGCTITDIDVTGIF